MNAMLSSSTTPSSSLVNKVGVAAPTTPQLSPQELLHKQQVCHFHIPIYPLPQFADQVTEYVSNLSPEQIQLQQSLVQVNHVFPHSVL